MNLLSQNLKMLRSSGEVWNFATTAYKDIYGKLNCIGAKECIPGCYARQGAYVWPQVRAKHQENLDITRTDDFIPLMIGEIQSKLKNINERLYIRIHDSGDFYSMAYLKKWLMIMEFFEGDDVKFYCYTKSLKLFKPMESRMPKNFRYVYSFGGKWDDLIDVKKDVHSIVFEDRQALKDEGYNDCTHDDLRIFKYKKIGLCYHGNKSWENTKWKDV